MLQRIIHANGLLLCVVIWRVQLQTMYTFGAKAQKLNISYVMSLKWLISESAQGVRSIKEIKVKAN